MREECMLKRKWVAAKLFAVVGGASLALGICVPKASAQVVNLGTLPPPFSNGNYLNRYICNETSDGNLFTGIIRIHTNGGGTFDGGTLEAPISNDGGVFVVGNPPPGNFCEFDLDV